MEKKKVVQVWYTEDKGPFNLGTGLILELEDGTLMRQNSTDPVQSFSEIDPEN